jgi:hypothetical protein
MSNVGCSGIPRTLRGTFWCVYMLSTDWVYLHNRHWLPQESPAHPAGHFPLSLPQSTPSLQLHLKRQVRPKYPSWWHDWSASGKMATKNYIVLLEIRALQGFFRHQHIHVYNKP